MSRNTKHKLYKKYLELQRRDVEIDEIQKNLGYVELEKPIHHGYTAKFILRDDIARRKDADIYLHLIAKYAVKTWSKTKEFYYKRRNYWIDSRPYFKVIKESEYNDLPLKYKRFFYHSPREDRKYWDGTVQRFFKCSLPEYYLVMKIEKDYYTHKKVCDGELEREQAFIERELRIIYREMNPFNDSMKSWGKAQNKSDRRSNKIALKKNLNTDFINDSHEYQKYIGNDITEKEFILDSDWTNWKYSSGWSEDPYEFKYKHRHGARWMRW